MPYTHESTDVDTHVQALKDCMQAFVDERDWQRFHTPKNLASSIAIEAAELMEHFQWLTPEESQQLSDETKLEVGEELSDVICYALSIANALEIDIASSMFRKMEKNRIKYPVLSTEDAE